MRKRKRSLFGESNLLRWRFRDNGLDGLGGGTLTPDGPAVEPDVPPVNGGPDRSYDSLANATIDVPNDTPATPASTVAPLTPADPNNAAGATQATSASQWRGIRDVAQDRGFRFDHTVTDDQSALEYLLRRADQNRQADFYAQLGRQLAPQAPQIQNYLQHQQQQAQPAQPQRNPWEAPEFDERWVSLVEQDQATGLFVAKQGVQHEIAQKVNEFVAWKKNYDRNPAAVINGMVEAKAKEIAKSEFQEQFASQQREQTVQSIMADNSRWLFQADASGQRAFDYNGQPILSPLGAAYLEQLKVVRQMGVTDPRHQDKLAKDLVRGQLAAAQYQQQGQQQAQAANQATQQAVAQPNRNPLQALPSAQRRVNPAATDPNEAGLSLSERIMRDLKANGVTDEDIRQSAEG
ncbi:hypothetical protein SAMN05444166_4193 [Singulisphaera sp. GP187]|uniref:hypothetical protein n=1 Tax=Singulisphaera sp. GP187 TaxID=1882752 RepID=UPI000927BDC0|nr:hypothetical protein [Singulisphaera sp. GP187]SIO37461.1 hypothetical protein SAMN05444166_4193 [Singulisphaera sp. GP187]